ncbi:TIGR04388 family protein [Leptospira sp. 'Mane']|uniref:TIGR04388 family protein n=1 Tax=Leptospira sp. 'Mane' TaxID=3387407 RepID=UPI00398B649E
MQEEHPAKRKFTRFTKTQAAIGLFSFVFTILFAGAVFSQEVIPQLQMQEYDSNVMNRVYGQSYFLNSIAGWTDQVSYYKGLLQASWEAAADNAIYDYVASITTSDAYNSVDAYKDYVQKELESQKLVAMNNWEDKANLDFLTNRNEFVLRLNTNRVDTTYLERMGVQTALSSQETNAIQLQQQIANATNNWNQNFNQGYQQGLNDFAGSLTAIQNKYDLFISTMNQSDAVFQDNLGEIDFYKSKVKDILKGMVFQFQDALASACDKAEDCTYRYASNNELNGAGTLLSGLVVRLNNVLNNDALDPSNVLTNISSEITNFLSTTTIGAHENSTAYYNKINTYQISTSLNGGISAATATQAEIDELVNRVRYGNYMYWDDMSETEQNWDKTENAEMFSNVGSSTLREMLKAIRDGDEYYARLLLGDKLGSRYQVEDILISNIFTHGGGKNCCFGVGINYAQNDDRNWLSEPNDFYYWEGVRYWEVARFHMGYITYGTLFKVFDTQSDAMYSYWNGNYESLNGQLNKYTNDINPAVRNWEGQVASYNSFYEQWKTNANDLKTQAKLDYENSIADLESKKTAWLAKMETERQDGLIKWEELQRNAANAESQKDITDLKSDFRATSSTGIDFSTGTNSILSNYGQTLVSLTNKEFVFQEPVRQESIISQNTIIPKEFFAGISDKVSSLGSFALGGLASGIGLVQTDPVIYKNLSLTTSSEGGVASLLTGGTTNTSPGKTFNIFGAAYQKTIDTSLTVNDKDIADVFQDTGNGAYQYSVLLSMNENNTRIAEREQEKLLNQLTWGIKWEDRAILKFDDRGNAVGKADYINMLVEMTNEKNPLMATCTASGTAYELCFNEVFKDNIGYLKSLGLEFQNGMIVNELTKEQKIRLGQTKDMTLTAEEKKLEGVCYITPESCKDLLRQDYTYTVNKETSVATLQRKISNGQIDGQVNGVYVDGKQIETRYVNLSQIAPVTAPKGKDLFDVWEDETFDEVADQRTAVLSDFYNVRLNEDAKKVSRSMGDISKVESQNEKKFQEAKRNQESSDSFLKEMLIAYISGGTAGFNAALKGKVEGAINSSIAGALVRATGGSEEQVQLIADAIGVLRGRMQAGKIKARANAMSINDPMLAMSNMMNKAFTAVFNNPEIMAGWAYYTKGASNIFFQGMRTLAVGAFAYKTLDNVGYETMKSQIVGSQATYRGIKANEDAVIKSYATTGLATASGLPVDVIDQLLTDFKGARDAKKARSTMNSNPYLVGAAMVQGIVGGIYKSALEATGMPEREISSFLTDIHSMAYAGNLDATAGERQTYNYMNLVAGIKTPGSSYTSNIPSDTRGLVTEIGQRIVVEELAKSSGMDKTVVDAWFRKGYGNIVQKRADRKAQSAAIRSTAITAVLTIATAGQQNVFGPGVTKFLTSVGNATGVTGSFAPAVGSAMVKGTIQVVDGASRNGWKGATAGLINGAIGVVTQGAFQGNAAAERLFNAARDSGLGLGVSYNERDGWGGMIGLGTQAQNFDFRFSEHGDDILSTSFGAANGLQITNSYNASSGAAGVGVNINSGRGPRQGFNFNINYDTKDRLSGGVSYTNQPSGLGISGNWNGGQASVSSQLNGVNTGTNSANGYTAEDFDWMQDNINRAQDARDRRLDDIKLLREGLTQNDINSLDEQIRKVLVARADENTLLREKGNMDDDTIANLTDEQREDLLKPLVKEPISLESIALASLGLVGTSAMAALAFMGLRVNSSTNPTVSVGAQVVAVRREDLEGADGENVGGATTPTSSGSTTPKTGKVEFGNNTEQLKVKIDTVSEILSPAEKTKLDANNKELDKLKSNKEKYSDLTNLLNDKASFDLYMKSPDVSLQEKAFLQYFKDKTVDLVGGTQTSANSDPFANLENEKKRAAAIAEIKKSSEYKILMRTIELDTTRLNNASNKIVNDAIVREVTKHSENASSAYAASLDRNILNLSEKDFRNYADNFILTKTQLANERLDLTNRIAELEESRNNANSTDNKKIQEQINQIQTRVTQLDTNIINHRMSMQVGEDPQHYLDRMKTSFNDELKAIPRIIEDIDAQIENEQSKQSVDRKKIEQLTILQNRYEEREGLVKDALKRTLPYEDLKPYITHTGEYKNQTIITTDKFKAPLGNPNQAEATISLNSHYGSDGYKASEAINAHIYGSAHAGIDIAAPLGTKVNSMLGGTVVGEPTLGASVRVLDSESLRRAGIVFDPTVRNINGQLGSYISMSDGTILTSADVRAIDPKFNPDSPTMKEMGVQYDATKKSYFVINSSEQSDRTYLTEKQVSEMNIPAEARLNPERLSAEGNSVRISTNLTGPYAGNYEVTYMHMNQPFTGDRTITPGEQIGEVGTTGRSTGSHLHVGVTTTTEPNIPAEFYDVEARNNQGEPTKWRINPTYFIKNMANTAE